MKPIVKKLSLYATIGTLEMFSSVGLRRILIKKITEGYGLCYY